MSRNQGIVSNGVVKVEKAIEYKPYRTVYPFEEMEPGDSFFLPKHYSRIHPVVAYHNKKRAGVKVWRCAKYVEKGVEGTRVWRRA